MSTPRPFKISVPDSRLNELRQKLSFAQFPDEIDNAEWRYGAPLEDVKRLVKYWRDGFDWRKQEQIINDSLPQFTKDVSVKGFGTLNIHFVHQRSSRKDAIPLLFVHGWPGSFLEVSRVLPLLTSPSSPGDPAFHVVAPSLPNFGFSEGVKKAGFGIFQYAECMNDLMKELGYGEYVSQGGDWGAWISRALAQSYPNNVNAIHINYARVNPPTFLAHPIAYLQHALTPYTPAEKAGLERSEWFHSHSYGYNLQQSTQPQTLGYGLTDSPVGLLAWIYEKLHNWSDHETYKWSDDEILTWISIYQFSRAGPAASLRIYFEIHNANQRPLLATLPTKGSKVSIGISVFPKDLGVLPKTWLRTMGNVVFLSIHESGGHFAATEKPEALVGDLRKMFRKKGVKARL